ncbi:MAG: hypothetical protein IPK16_08610 [Anaerolineales bacterium]|nr:hypothetical protein [Anaerolineales bacterium]
MSAEPPLEFVDTNVLIYAYDRTAGDRHLRAKVLVAELRLILNDLALWRVHTPDASDVLAAADLHQLLFPWNPRQLQDRRC